MHILYFLFIVQSLFTNHSIVMAGNNELTVPDLIKIDLVEQQKIKNLIKEHSGETQRPSSCPLESNKHLDILTKIDNIKKLFRDNCLDTDQTRLDEILAGATELQEEINKVQEANNELVTDSSDNTDLFDLSDTSIDVAGVSLDGEKIAEIVGNINSIYKERSCQSLLNNQTFLNKSADVITDFAKIGLLVPNTYALAVAGGGIALSSILLILDNLLERRFDFEKTDDRQSFIKLNCAFYDIRKDIEKSGFIDVPTQAHKDDIEEVETNVDFLHLKTKELDERFKEINDLVEKNLADFQKIKLGYLHSLKDVLTEVLSNLDNAVSTNGEKLFVIQKLSQKYNLLSSLMNEYHHSNESDIPLLDLLFIKEINRLDHVRFPGNYMTLVNMDPILFKENYISVFDFHAKRILEVISTKEEEISKDWFKEVVINGKSFEGYQKELIEEYAESKSSWSKMYLDLANVKQRLKRILDSEGFSSEDEGVENIVSILSDYKKIVEQIYGKYGKNFLEYTTETSLKENKNFNKKFSKFVHNHLEIEEVDGNVKYMIKDSGNLGRMRVLFACQDARPFRRIWKYSESLAQQGYDFVSTNSDLFHADIPRIFFGNSGGRYGIHNFLSKYEKIQMHHKSALYAQDFLSGIDLPKRTFKKYLKPDYLGKAMIEVNKSQDKAEILQSLIEKYDCINATRME